MNPDGARHAARACIAIIGAMSLFGGCLYFFANLLPRWLNPDLPGASEVKSPRDALKWQSAHTRSHAGSNLLVGLSAAVTAIFVFIVLSFW